ncbi:lanthionine synthetase LanC family protein [Phenylobacterium aquaticum]|uniref:lanthionine synthetase LanC family protein n=1 Tax=Phenylobacterium aquaticum TaxID=1763816 RepID=UPI0026F1A550|nr:lanthionine synthetase LanC family protein [Phenylobacterium aquaticum]
MNRHMTTALQAVNFIRAQKVEGRAKWRRWDDEGAIADYSLYHGSSGVILLLLELHAAGQDDGALAEAVAAGEEVVEYLARKESLSVSMSTGWPGYAFAMGELARVSGREDFRACAVRCLDKLHAQSTPVGAGIGWIETAPFADITGFSGQREIYDQSVGAAGAGLLLVYAHRQGLHPQALAWATAVAERLLEVAEPDPDGLRWRLMNDMPFPFTAPNFAHGGAGVGYFLTQLFRETGDARYLDAAREAARYTMSRAKPMGEHGKLVVHTEEARRPIFYLGACHGPAGTGRLLLELHALTGEDHWLAEAKALVEGLIATGAPRARSTGYWNNFGQCCGDAGVGEFALLMAARTGDDYYHELAQACAGVIEDVSELTDGARRWVQAEHRERPDFLQAQTGYMQGAAGIASFLLHLATTEAGAPVKIAMPDWPVV